MILLVDNGSLEPASTLGLRMIARRLGEALGQPVEPVSLLHSSTIPANRLEGEPAEILEPALERRLKSGVSSFLVLPLFFGPSGALTGYLPKRIATLKTKYPSLRVRLAPPLVNPADPADQRIAAILEERILAALARSASPAKQQNPTNPTPAVVLVDHGSPLPAVTAVRNHVTQQLRSRLGPKIHVLVAASMERRPGPEFAFADPLLQDALDQPALLSSGGVIVALLFLAAGRHAGPNGDVAQICTAAALRHSGLVTTLTEPIGSHPGLIPILVDRAKAGLAGEPL